MTHTPLAASEKMQQKMHEIKLQVFVRTNYRKIFFVTFFFEKSAIVIKDTILTTEMVTIAQRTHEDSRAYSAYEA